MTKSLGALLAAGLAGLQFLAVLAVVFSSWARSRYGWLTVLAAAAGAVTVVVARISGEAFKEGLGVGGAAVETHEMWGQLAPFPAVALALFLPVALLMESRSRPAWWTFVVLTAIAAVAALVLVVLTGHSGATAVWGG